MDGQEVQAEWISYREAQRITGLGRTSLWHLANEGTIPVAKHGRARRLNRKALEDHMWGCVPGGHSEVPEDHR